MQSYAYHYKDEENQGVRQTYRQLGMKEAHKMSGSNLKCKQ